MNAQETSIVIPTLNGGELFARCLEAIRNQNFDGKTELVVVDSGSTDGTAARAEAAGAMVIRIRPSDFHHADTRNLALRHTSCDCVVYTVQDAIPATKTWLRDLCRTLSDPRVAAAYGRPIAHDGAGVYARFEADGISRYLGDTPYLQELSGPEAYAAMSFDEAYRVTRLDNVCAIYRRSALRDCPFPRVPYAEDMAWALNMLLKGARILYDPEVAVRHSHERPADYIFRRHVVDSVYCAKILGKLRRDLPPISAEKLKALTACVDSRAMSLLSTKKMIPCTEKHPEPGTPQQSVTATVWDEIDYLWNFITNSYSFQGTTDAAETLQKVVASVLGKCYGDLYACSTAKGNLDAAFRDCVEPYLKGI